MYSRDDIDKVRHATDMVALVSGQTQLKRSGTRWVGLCPFHTEKTPSFSVNAEEHFYYCFGCKASGDCFSFVQQTENLEFAEAVELLADKANVSITRTGGSSQQDSSRKQLQGALQEAAEWYHNQLFEPGARAARDYLRQRGYNSDIAKRWQMGWAPGSWDNPQQGLRGALKYPPELLRKAGLLRQTDQGGLRDVQQSRIVFPICNHKGDVIAFGGRILPGRDKAPKYINSPETPLYKKSQVLYGLDRAKKEIVNQDGVIIAEGYTDVIGLHEMGFANAVATCGTALTKEHLESLKRFSSNISLAFDPDSSGQAAAERIHQWENELRLNVKIVNLAEHGDPGDISQRFIELEKQLAEHQHTAEVEREMEQLRHVFIETQDYMQFRIDRAVGGSPEAVSSRSVSVPQERLELALKATEVISDHPEREIRNQYIGAVSLRFDVDEDPLWRELQKLLDNRDLRRGRQPPVQSRHASSQSGYSQHDYSQQHESEQPPMDAPGPAAPPQLSREEQNEAKSLLLLCHFPAEVPEYFDEWLFSNKLHRSVCRALLTYETYEDIKAAEPNEVYGMVVGLKVQEPPEGWPEGGAEDPQALLVQLLMDQANRRLRELDRQTKRAGRLAQAAASNPAAAGSATGAGGDEPVSQAQLTQLFDEQRDLKLALDELRHQRHTLDAAEELLLPLLEHAENVPAELPRDELPRDEPPQDEPLQDEPPPSEPHLDDIEVAGSDKLTKV